MKNKQFKFKGFSLETFTKKIWKNKTKLYKNAFCPSLFSLNDQEIEDLLNCDEIEKRIIYKNNKSFKYIKSSRPKKINEIINNHASTVFIQNIDFYEENYKDILNFFQFMPKFLIEDAMFSISNKDGSSGPHVDYYDVFIMQIQGEKNWKIEKRKRLFEENEDDYLLKNQEIKLLNSFDEDYDEYNLKPGDLLYIPSKFAHHATNYSDENSISISIGSRSPKVKDLFMKHLIPLVDSIHDDARIEDRFNKIANIYEIPQNYFEILKKQPLLKTIPAKELILLYGKEVTNNLYFENKLEISLVSEFKQILNNMNGKILIDSTARIAYYLDRNILLFINSNYIKLPKTYLKPLLAILNNGFITWSKQNPLGKDDFLFLNFLVTSNGADFE